MPFICLSTAMAITGLSKRTLWRRIGEGRIATDNKPAPGEKTLVDLKDVLKCASLELNPEEYAIVSDADQGDREAQCNLGLLLMKAGRQDNAIHWLALSAKQLHPIAMCYLGKYHFTDQGVERSDISSLIWLIQLADAGNLIAKDLVTFLKSTTN